MEKIKVGLKFPHPEFTNISEHLDHDLAKLLILGELAFDRQCWYGTDAIEFGEPVSDVDSTKMDVAYSDSGALNEFMSAVAALGYTVQIV